LDPLISEVFEDGVTRAEYLHGYFLNAQRQEGTTVWCHLDGQFSIRQWSDSQQNLLSNQLYESFGHVASSAGLARSPFGYVGSDGYYGDPQLDLLLVGLRQYDPASGRFVSQDPGRFDYNWYLYVEASPVDDSDPTGLMSSRCTYNRLEYDLSTSSPPWLDFLGEIPIGYGRIKPKVNCRVSLRATHISCQTHCKDCVRVRTVECQGGAVAECTGELVWYPPLPKWFPLADWLQVWGFVSVNYELRGKVKKDPCVGCPVCGVEGKLRVSIGARGGIRDPKKRCEAWGGVEVQGRAIWAAECDCKSCHLTGQVCGAGRARLFASCLRWRYTWIQEIRSCLPYTKTDAGSGTNACGELARLCPGL